MPTQNLFISGKQLLSTHQIGKSSQTMRRGFTAFFKLLIIFLTAPCPNLTIANGMIDPIYPLYNGAYLLNHIAKIQCDQGYIYNRTGRTVGYIECTANQTWYPPLERCIADNFGICLDSNLSYSLHKIL